MKGIHDEPILREIINQVERLDPSLLLVLLSVCKRWNIKVKQRLYKHLKLCVVQINADV